MILNSNTDDGHYFSPTMGKLTFSHLRKNILSFMAKDPDSRYQIIVGSDSQPKNGSGVDFITAIIVHRKGHGGIYFWRRYFDGKMMVLRTRIYQEATLSLLAAEEFISVFKADGITKYDIEIHVDIGNAGKTREMIAEVVGMIRGSGFIVKTKPEAYGASKVADRHT